MKSVIITLVLAITFSHVGLSQTPAPPADEIMKEAYQRAAAENKNVFLLFHSSWCIWCHRIDTSMNEPYLNNAFQNNYVICHLVVDESRGKQYLENPGANDIRIKYHGDGIDVPFWLIFDKNGKAIADSKMRPDGASLDVNGENMGCPSTEKEIAVFLKILKRTSKLTDDQLQLIAKRFRENEQ